MTTTTLSWMGRAKRHIDEAETPFINFTDALTGILFIFLILILILALNQQATTQTEEGNTKLLDELQRKVAMMLLHRDLLGGEIVKLEGEQAQAVIVLNEINMQRDEAAQNLAVLQINLGDGSSELATINQNVDQAKRTLTAIEQNILGANATQSELEGNLLSLQQQIAIAQAANDKASSDNAAINIQLGDLKSQRAAREEEVQGLTIAIERGKSEMGTLQTQIEGLKAALGSLESERSGAENGRTILLDTIQAKLEQGGITGVTVDRSNDSLVLQEEILFDTGSSSINSPSAIRTVIRTLVEILPCSTAGMQRPMDCDDKVGTLAGVLIEGHADRQGDASDNMVLSSKRAMAVYDQIMLSPQLSAARAYGSDGGSGGLFGIAGYGETRLAVPTADGVKNAQNRRIAIRLLFMARS